MHVPEEYSDTRKLIPLYQKGKILSCQKQQYRRFLHGTLNKLTVYEKPCKMRGQLRYSYHQMTSGRYGLGVKSLQEMTQSFGEEIFAVHGSFAPIITERIQNMGGW